MLPTKRLHEVGVVLLSLSIAIAIGCTGVDNATSVHGSVTGFGDGKANNITVSPPSASVMRGATTPLKCQALDSRGVVVSTTPSWTIADPGVATIDAAGIVTGTRGGNTMASCVVDGKAASSLVTVIETPVTFLEVTPGADAVVVGSNTQLIGTPRDSTGAALDGFPVQWSTLDTSIAAVSTGGVVVARAEGTANIVATSGGQVSYAKISVSKVPPVPVAGIYISLNGSGSTLNAGQVVHASAVTVDAAGRTLTGRAITWASSNNSVFTVVGTSSDKANITGRGQGSATLTVTSEGKSFSTNLTVGVAPVQTVNVTLGSSKILPGQTTQATATVTDAVGNPLTGRTVTWTSLDPSIANVAPNGVVSAVSTGAVVIRAISEGATGDATETVGVDPVATVTVVLGSASLNPGQTMGAQAIVRDATGNVLNGRTVSWSSLNTSIATVSIGGTVSAVAPGNATIRATVESQTGDGTFTVTAPAPTQQPTSPPPPAPTASVSVTLDSTSLAPGHSAGAHSVAKDSKGNVLSGKTTVWASLNPTVASVTAAGVVTAQSAGTASIQGTIDGINGAGSLTVIVPPVVPPQGTADSLAEPAFDGTPSKMLFQQSFDTYTTDTLRPPCGTVPAATPKRVVDSSIQHCTPGAGWSYDSDVSIGAGHSGNAVTIHYDGPYQETHSAVMVLGTSTGKGMTVIQYWAKFTPDPGYVLDANAQIQIKNIMLWNDQARFQWDTHAHNSGCPFHAPSATTIGGIEMLDDGCDADQAVGPYFQNYADGQWHRWTVEYKPNTSTTVVNGTGTASTRDGVARLWIDGILTNNLERGACGITPPGGYKPWCDPVELDGLWGGNTGVLALQWGANRTDGSGIKFTLAIDDVKWWMK